jgi:uncharacterized protein YgbK (DUF1537 family)
MSDLLLSFYGDDFTGSTDVMEALASHGIKTVLFTRKPSEAEFKPFASYQAIGLAGTSRSQSPDWMEAHLPEVFVWLKSLDARFCHYKVCSTIDSSPIVGSIGKAIDIGRRVYNQATVPLVVGAPQLKRYTAFGHLFAAYRGEIYLIDRHPVMSRHPVTPMGEADLRLHLARQTKTPIALADLTVLAGPDATIDAFVAEANGIILFDVADERTQVAAGKQLLKLSQTAGPFLVGSSGVEYALIAALRQAASSDFPPLGKVNRIAVLSGSVSATTERQIRHALANGFDGLEVNLSHLLGDGETETSRLVTLAGASLAAGRSVIIYTALGPASDEAVAIDAMPHARHMIGERLGRIARALVEAAGLRRIVFAGGDTSSHALGQLDVHALTTRFPLISTPGSPLCTAHSVNSRLHGIEIAMKGGQVGDDGYFVMLRDGM